MGLIRFFILMMVIASSSRAGAEGQPASLPEERPLLIISGQIGKAHNEASDQKAAHFSRAMLESLPRTSLYTSTVVTDGVHHFEGVLVRALLSLVEADGKTADAFALNDYVISIPVEDFYTYDVIIADTMNGAPLTSRDKGPLWVVYPRDQHRELQDIRYDYRWVWQLYRLDIR